MNVAPDIKRCSVCHEHKSLSEFSKNASATDGLNSKCVTCNQACARAWYASNRDRASESTRQWRAKHPGARTIGAKGADLYNEILARQGGTCALCDKTPEDNGRLLSIDHDHSCCPGRRACRECVRGLLCLSDNLMLGRHEAGGYKVPVKFAEKAEQYLMYTPMKVAA